MKLTRLSNILSLFAAGVLSRPTERLIENREGPICSTVEGACNSKGGSVEQVEAPQAPGPICGSTEGACNGKRAPVEKLEDRQGPICGSTEGACNGKRN